MNIDQELAQHHFATMRAIESGRTEIAVRRLDAYVRYAEAFLDAAGKRGIAFSIEAASRISLMGWRTPSQIINDAQRGVLAAVKSGNLELIAHASHVPVKIMKLSVSRSDFLFYKKMSQMYPLMLAASYTIDSNSGRAMVVDRSWRYLREFADFIFPKLAAEHEAKVRGEFASVLLWCFGDLMKVAMDHNDASAFATIGKEMNSLFESRHLRILGLSGDAASSLDASAKEERSVIWFGFGSWIIRSFVLKDVAPVAGQPDPKMVDPAKIPAFLDMVSANFANIKQLARVYERAVECEQESPVWEWWLSETLPEREVHTFDFRRWLTYFYVVTGLRLSSAGGIAPLDVPEPSRNLQFVINDVRDKVTHIRENKQQWAPVIPWLTAQSVANKPDETPWEHFVFANETSAKEWTKRREDDVIRSPLDPLRVSLFRQECLRGWQQRSWLVSAISELGQRVDKIAEEDTTYMAVDQLFPKEAFIKARDSEYVGFGLNEGEILGRDICANLLSVIEKNATVFRGDGTDSIKDRVAATVSAITHKNKKSTAILAVGDFELERQFRNVLGFSQREKQPKPRFDFPEYIGDLYEVPVFFTFLGRGDGTRITVADLGLMGIMTWHNPPKDNFGGLLVRITEIDEAEAKRIITAQPKRLMSDSGSEVPREAAIRDLQMKAHSFVGVKIDLEILNPAAITRISID